jgi:hypothetical protein
VGLSGRETAELVLDPIEEEVSLMYDAQTAARLTHAFRCSNRPGPCGSR